MRGLWLLPAALLLAIPLGADQTRHPTPLPESPHLQPNGVTTYVPPSPWAAAEGDPEPPESYLLLEDGSSNLLLEDSSLIVLE